MESTINPEEPIDDPDWNPGAWAAWQQECLDNPATASVCPVFWGCKHCDHWQPYTGKCSRCGEETDDPDRLCEEYAEDQTWLCDCGNFIEDGRHCPSCKREPPWGCPCCDDIELDEEEDYGDPPF